MRGLSLHMNEGGRALLFERALREDNRVVYGDATCYEFWIKNVSISRIRVRSICVQLQADGEHDDPALINADEGLNLRLAGGEKRAVQISVTVPLSAQIASNYITIRAEFEILAPEGLGPVRSERTPDHFDYLNVHNATSHADAQVFVSFVDPENAPLADIAARYLRRAGMLPYLAKNDLRPGCHNWEDKILPAIERSAGVLVIWTGDAVLRPENVIREINHALSAGIPVGLYLSRDAAPPEQLPRSIKEYLRFDIETASAAFARAIAAGATRWRRTNRFFG